jgi:hypothetical protein
MKPSVYKLFISKINFDILNKTIGIEEWGIASATNTKTNLNTLAQDKFPKIRILSTWNEGPVGGINRRIEKYLQIFSAYREGISSFYLSSEFNPALITAKWIKLNAKESINC